MSDCTNLECAAIALALESAMSDPPKALAALTTIEAKAAEALMGRIAQLTADNAALRETLRVHWLADIGCDYEEHTDSPRCACSLVNLGTYTSVGAAVEAWAKHVESIAKETP